MKTFILRDQRSRSKIFSHFTVTPLIFIEVATVQKSFVMITMINPPNLHSREPK